jgi:hypothetical protein
MHTRANRGAADLGKVEPTSGNVRCKEHGLLSGEEILEYVHALLLLDLTVKLGEGDAWPHPGGT